MKGVKEEVTFVDIYQMSYNIHCLTGAVNKKPVRKQIADKHGREEVASAGEVNGNLAIRQDEVLIVKMVVAHYGSLAVNAYTRDKHRLGTNLSQGVN